MVANELDQVLVESVTEVLESMFFTSLLEEHETMSGLPECISVQLSFQGGAVGTFGILVPPETARTIGANFLGLDQDEISSTQTGEVVCELANMLCGSALSRLGNASRLALSPPAIQPPGSGRPADATVCHTFELDEGRVVVWLRLGSAL